MEILYRDTMISTFPAFLAVPDSHLISIRCYCAMSYQHVCRSSRSLRVSDNKNQIRQWSSCFHMIFAFLQAYKLFHLSILNFLIRFSSSSLYSVHIYFSNSLTRSVNRETSFFAASSTIPSIHLWPGVQ